MYLKTKYLMIMTRRRRVMMILISTGRCNEEYSLAEKIDAPP
jgi:hypothetical protein